MTSKEGTRLIRSIRNAEKAFSEEIKMDGLSPSATLLLAELYSAPSSFTQMAESLGLSKGRLSRLVSHLEDKELIIRKADPNDGRAFILELSPDARKLGKEASRLVGTAYLQSRERLGEAGEAMLREQLGKV